MDTETSPGNCGVPVPLPCSTAQQSNMPKAWKYFCYKDSWAECAWCLSLCFAHCATAANPEFQECQYREGCGSAHRQAANLLLTTEPPQSLTHFVQRGCIPSLRCFGGSRIRKYLAFTTRSLGEENRQCWEPWVRAKS